LASYLQNTQVICRLAGVKTENMELEDHLINLVEDEINTNVIADEMGISPSLFLLPKPSEIITQPPHVRHTALRTWIRV